MLHNPKVVQSLSAPLAALFGEFSDISGAESLPTRAIPRRQWAVGEAGRADSLLGREEVRP